MVLLLLACDGGYSCGRNVAHDLVGRDVGRVVDRGEQARDFCHCRVAGSCSFGIVIESPVQGSG